MYRSKIKEQYRTNRKGVKIFSDKEYFVLFDVPEVEMSIIVDPDSGLLSDTYQSKLETPSPTGCIQSLEAEVILVPKNDSYQRELGIFKDKLLSGYKVITGKYQKASILLMIKDKIGTENSELSVHSTTSEALLDQEKTVFPSRLRVKSIAWFDPKEELPLFYSFDNKITLSGEGQPVDTTTTTTRRFF